MTIYVAPKSILRDIERSLRMRYNVVLPEQLPCDSVKWAIEHKRDLSGYTDMHALGIAEDGTIYLALDTLVREDKPEEFPVDIEISAGRACVTIHHQQVVNLNLVHNINDKLVEVSEITITE